MRINHFIASLLRPTSAGGSHCNGRHALWRWLIGASVVLLAACATPGGVAPGATEAQVAATLGRPTAVYALTDGGQRWYYPQGGVQQQAWMLDFDRGGRLVANNQVHRVEFFAKIVVDRDTEADVTHLLGPPAWTEHYGPMGLTGWVYPYLEQGWWTSVTTVMFDRNGVVRRVQSGPDPRFAGGGDNRH
jgi:hypothetical protein